MGRISSLFGRHGPHYLIYVKALWPTVEITCLTSPPNLGAITMQTKEQRGLGKTKVKEELRRWHDIEIKSVLAACRYQTKAGMVAAESSIAAAPLDSVHAADRRAEITSL